MLYYLRQVQKWGCTTFIFLTYNIHLQKKCDIRVKDNVFQNNNAWDATHSFRIIIPSLCIQCTIILKMYETFLILNIELEELKKKEGKKDIKKDKKICKNLYS